MCCFRLGFGFVVWIRRYCGCCSSCCFEGCVPAVLACFGWRVVACFAAFVLGMDVGCWLGGFRCFVGLGLGLQVLFRLLDGGLVLVVF